VAKARRGRRPRPRNNDAPSGGGREHLRADGRPKTSYRTADDANRHALQVRLEQGVQLAPYVCGICGAWHVGNSRD
jgi:hypothetical protein